MPSFGVSTTGDLAGTRLPNPLVSKLNGDILAPSLPEADSEDVGNLNPLAHWEKPDAGLAFPGTSSGVFTPVVWEKEADRWFGTREVFWSGADISEDDRPIEGELLSLVTSTEGSVSTASAILEQ